MGRLTPNEEQDLKTLYQVIAQRNALDGVDLSSRDAIFKAISECLPEKEYKYFLALNAKKNQPEGEAEEEEDYLPKKAEQPKNLREKPQEAPADANARWETERKKIHELYQRKIDPLGSLTYGKAENDRDAEQEVYIRQVYKIGKDGAPQYWNFENDLHCLKNIYFAEEKAAREEARKSGDAQKIAETKSAVPAEPGALPAYAAAFAATNTSGYTLKQEREFLLRGIELLENENFHPDKILEHADEKKKPDSPEPVTMEQREAVYQKLRSVMAARLEEQKKAFEGKTAEQGYKDMLNGPDGLATVEYYRWMTGLSGAIDDLTVHNRIYNAKNDLDSANRSRKALEKYMDSKIDGFYVGKTNHYEMEQEYESTCRSAELLQESYKKYYEPNEKNVRLQYEADVKRLEEEKAALDREQDELEDELIKRYEEQVALSESIPQERATIDILRTAAQEESERNERLVREKSAEIEAYEKKVLEGLVAADQESYEREVERINSWFIAQGVREEAFRAEDAASYEAYCDVKGALDTKLMSAQQLLQKHTEWFAFRETFSGKEEATGSVDTLEKGRLESLGDRPEEEEQIDADLNTLEKALVGGNLTVGSILDLKRAHQQNRLSPEEAAKELAAAKEKCREAVKQLEELYPDASYRSEKKHIKQLEKMQNAADEEAFYEAAQELVQEGEDKRAALVKACEQKIESFAKKLEKDDRFVKSPELQKQLNEAGSRYAEAMTSGSPDAEKLKDEFAKLQSAHINNGIKHDQLDRFRAVMADHGKYHQLLADYATGEAYDEIAGNPNDHIELKEAIVKRDALEKACKAEMLEIARKVLEDKKAQMREDVRQQMANKAQALSDEVHKIDENGKTAGSILHEHSASLSRMLERKAVLREEVKALKARKEENLKKKEEKLQELTDRNKKYEDDLAEGKKIQEEYKELKARAEIQNGILNIELPQMQEKFYLLSKQNKDIQLRYDLDPEKKDDIGFIDPDHIHQFSGTLRENAARDLKHYLETAQVGRGAHRGADSQEFKNMTDSLREALGMTGKAGAENAFKYGSLKEVKTQLEKIQTAAHAYIEAKEGQEWWHLFHTDMRKARLGYAKQLENYAKGALQTINGITGEKNKQYGLEAELDNIQDSFQSLTGSFGSNDANPFDTYEKNVEKYRKAVKEGKLSTEETTEVVEQKDGNGPSEVKTEKNPVTKPEMQAFMDSCLNPRVIKKASKCKGNLPFKLHCYIEKDKQLKLEESLKLYNDGAQKDGAKKEGSIKSFFKNIAAILKY